MDFPNDILYFHEILDKLHIAVYVVDSDRRLVYINHAAERLEQMDRTTSLGKPYEHFWTTITPEALDCPILDSLDTGRVYNYENLMWKTVGGEYINAITSAYPIVKDGKIIGAITLAENVNSMKRQLFRKGFFLPKVGKSTEKAPMENGTLYTLADVVGSSPAMTSVMNTAKAFASQNFPVMIWGEPGLGETLFAQGIHNDSNAARGRFVSLECSAISGDLLEPMLFGRADRRGILERADYGSVFLKDVQAIPLSTQKTLLQVLKEQAVCRLGATRAIPIHCRVLSSINQDPQMAMAKGLLLEELYYYLSVGLLALPPLRGRRQDIADLTNHFLQTYDSAHGVPCVTDAVLQLFQLYRWPGNVGELATTIAKALDRTTAQDMMLDFQHIPDFMIRQICNNFFTSDFQLPAPPKAEPEPELPPISFLDNGLEQRVASFEKQLICAALEGSGGKMATAARILQISRQSLYQKMKKFSIELPEKSNRQL